MTAAKIQMDTVDYQDPDFQQFLSEHNITYKVIVEHGPAGGASVVEYMGSRDALCTMIMEQFDSGSDAQNQDYLSEIADA